MRRFITRLLFLVPIPILVIVTNIAVDPANIRDEGPFEEYAASMILSGRNVANLRNCNERLLQKKVIEGTTTAPDVLVLGSSRTMQISSACYPERRFLNASISGAQLEDFIGVYGLLRRHDLTPKQVIIGLDGSLLNLADKRYRWNSLELEYEELASQLGLTSNAKALLLGDNRRYLELASPAYFRESVKALLVHGGLDREFWPTENRNELVQVRMADGSLSYGEDVRGRSTDEVDMEAMKFATTGNTLFGLNQFTAIDEGRLVRLDRFVGYLEDTGVDVLLFVPPYHPIVWKVISSDPAYENVIESEARFRLIASKHGVPIVGSFDPGALNLASADFHDGMHPTKDAVRRILRCSQAL